MKTKTQHTPGPWKVKTHPLAVLSVGRNVIADVTANVPDDGILTDEIMGIAFANARLIAAAPTLLDLARRIVMPDSGRDYTDAKEELMQLVLKLSGDANGE